MTLNDAAVLVANAGNYFTAPYLSGGPTALPADLTAVTTPFVKVGHTSLEDIISITSEGGDATTIGTLQNKTLRTTYTNRTDTINFTLQQFDTDSLKLYYGSNASVGSSGEVQVPVNPTPTICTFLAVFTDGDNVFAIYAPKAEIFRSDDLAVSDTESLAGLPLAVKPLVHSTNEWTYAVTPIGDVEG